MKTINSLLLACCICCLFDACRQSQETREFTPFNEAYLPYISAYTTGTISRAEDIMVRLSENIAGQDSLSHLPIDILHFTPSIKGEATWLDGRTLVFKPEGLLPVNKFYKARFELGKVMQVEDALSEFHFDFMTRKQSVELVVRSIETPDPAKMVNLVLNGVLFTADVSKQESMVGILSASQEGTELEVTWQEPIGGTQFPFVVKGVKRGKEASQISLTYNGSVIGADSEGKKITDIPALGDFKIMDIQVSNEGDQHLIIEFSDPLDEQQDFNGLIRIENNTNLSFIAENNLLRVYINARLAGEYSVRVERGIKNVLGNKLPRFVKYDIKFEELNPAVRLIGKGVIIPRSQGMVLPFEAVNLNAVDVMVTRIYEQNILQFLQENDLSNQYQINRVGKVIARKVIPLQAPAPQHNQWHRYGLQLDEFINQEPGAIYRVFIGFRKSQSLLSCEDSGIQDQPPGSQQHTVETTSDEYWAPYQGYNYYYYGYDWNQRDNPCNDSYYNRSRMVQTNMLSSDIGIVAKKGKNNEIICVVTNLNSTAPMKGVDIHIYDYQQISMGKAVTDKNGRAKFHFKNDQPFFVVASKDNQNSYLRLADGEALMLSKFDVSGVQLKEGIKGYIYGERSVWRPGDSLYLSFILEDAENSLPEKHPIKFEMYNVKNQLVYKTFRKKGKHNLYTFRFATDADAQTGNWLAQVTVGNNVFSKSLKIETVKPNRLKIDLDLEQDYLSKNGENSVTLQSKWLHGATTRNLEAKVEAILSNINTVFKGYEKYEFDDPSVKFNAEPVVVFEGNTDEEGNANFDISLPVGTSVPGQLMANLKARVFEEGGDFSTFQMSIPYHPYENYVGVWMPQEDIRYNRLPAGKKFDVAVAAVNKEGQPLKSRQVAVEVYELSWRWWWQSRDNSISNYIRRQSIVPIFTDSVEVKNGKVNWSFEFEEEKGGRFYVQVKDLEGDHSTGHIFYIEWPHWYRITSDMDGANLLSFATDKENYMVGEKIQLNIPAGEDGRAFISIENGIKVVQSFWMETEKGDNKVTINTTKGMAPNVYINVMLIQPHAQTSNDLPMRLFGVVPVMVEDPVSHLYPAISMANELRPETKNNIITVSEENGRAMNYTIAIVDEGLLDLTNFQTPEPWGHFYAREALGVQTWDLYDMVLGAYNGKLERFLSVGGDAAVKTKRPDSKVNRFPPMVRFLGPFRLEAGQKATHRFSVPQYIGSVRAMVVAANETRSYGATDITVPVRKPLMVMGTLPRVLGPAEEVSLPVTVFAMKDNIKDVAITVEGNSLVEFTEGKSQSVRFDRTGEQTLFFKIKVKEGLGVAKVAINGKSGNETARFELELQVRNPNPEMLDVVAKVLDEGQSWSVNYEPLGMAGTNGAVLEVSSLPPLNLGKRLQYLIRYPYGCLEQTTSSAFPQLYVQDVVELPDYKKKMITNHINSAIQRIQRFQHSNGGLVYWPGNNYIDDWSTSYTGHFMLEAKKKGYQLPYNFLSNWVRYQKKLARKWTPFTSSSNSNYGQNYTSHPENRRELVQAYRLYTLAIAGEADLSSMNQLREQPGLFVTAKWQLAAAYAIAGMESIGKEMVQELTTTIPEYQGHSITYGSRSRDEAIILETLTLLKMDAEAFPLVQRISHDLSSNNWMSTQTTAFCLMSMTKYFNQHASNFTEFSYVLQGKKEEVHSKSAIVQLNASQPDKNGDVSLKNLGDGKLYVRLVRKGQPVVGMEEARANNISMAVKYKTINGKTLDITSLEQGTDFLAEVTVKNTTNAYIDNLALSQIFPSGWEITNTRLDAGDYFDGGSTPDYQDLRDDRVYTFFNSARYTTKTFRVLLNASYLGRYYLPAVQCEAMYDENIHANTAGQWVEVVKPGEILGMK